MCYKLEITTQQVQMINLVLKAQRWKFVKHKKILTKTNGKYDQISMRILFDSILLSIRSFPKVLKSVPLVLFNKRTFLGGALNIGVCEVVGGYHTCFADRMIVIQK